MGHRTWKFGHSSLERSPYCIFFSNNVSYEFAKFRVDTYLCKLRDTPGSFLVTIVRFFVRGRRKFETRFARIKSAVGLWKCKVCHSRLSRCAVYRGSTGKSVGRLGDTLLL